MKKLLYGISLFLFAGSAWASLQVQTQTPNNVCARLNPKETRDACYNLIAGASFDELAVGICDVLNTTPNTLACLKTIKDAPFYNHNAVNICYRNQDESDITQCLDDIATEYFENEAVLACDRIKEDVLATDCLESVTGKTFDSGIIDKCDSLSSAEKTIDCFDHYSKDATHEQLNDLRNTPTPQFKRTPGKNTLNFSQFVPKCVPEKQNCNSKLEKDIQDSNDIVRRLMDFSKKSSK